MENRNKRDRRREEEVQETWVPKTSLGKDVLNSKYSSIQEVIKSGRAIMESKIIDYLEPNFEVNFVNVGQAKGKFGGGRRKTSKQTQKTTNEGSKTSFSMVAVSGNREGIVGLGFGKASEAVPAREKAINKAKQNIIITRRGCGDWGASQKNTNSIPFAVEGKSGSCYIKLIPAPPGTGLVTEIEVKKLLELAGIKDIWSRTRGSTKNKNNLMKAAFNALKALQNVRINSFVMEGRAIKEGSDYEFGGSENGK